MKNIMCAVALSLLAFWPARAEILSTEDQTRIITAYGIATGQIAAPVVSKEDKKRPPDKCGTAAVNSFLQSRDFIDPALLSALGVQLAGRPDSLILPKAYGSPAGRFLVHYVDTGFNAVYQPTVRTLVDTVPDYVVMVARIADSVYTHIIDSLGYPQPPVDGFYSTGLDDRFDIYLLNLSAQFYGLTYLDAQVSSITATSYLVLDNDYQSIESYIDRPLDAVRVTIAHEYFHAVQFGMDFTEYDGYPAPTRRQYWMEMSATWMEEECYDEINDYYAYLPYFLNVPDISLQAFGGTYNLHPYGAGLFPIFLAQKYDRDIIRQIWQECAARGPNTQFLAACEFIIRANDPPDANLATALNEFSIWNYFTGKYASAAPNGMRYEEAAEYPVIPLEAFSSVSKYPHIEAVTDTVGFRPEYNSTAYMLFQNLGDRNSCYGCIVVDTSATPDTVVGISCGSGNPQYKDSAVQLSCDSVMRITIGFQSKVLLAEPTTLAISIIYQHLDIADSTEINRFEIPVATTTGFQFLEIFAYHPDRYRSIAVAFSPTSSSDDPSLYSAFNAPKFGYAISDSGGFASRPTAALTPYPNPAVVSSMGGQPITFRFQVANDSTNSNITTDPLLLVDLFTIAGEFVKSINATFGGEDRLGVHSEGIYETAWNMKNSAGKDVASGVYLAYARLWDSAAKNTLLADSKVKVALIR